MLTACLLLCLLAADPAAPIDVRVLAAEGAKVEFVGTFATGQLEKLPDGNLNPEIAERWLRVTLVDEATGKDGPAIFGTYKKLSDGNLSFRPRFPLSAGGLYRASINGVLGKIETREYRVPASPKAAAPQVTEIYPTANRLPANLLKFYIHFSRPMREGEAVFDNVQLLNEKNQPLVDCWRLTELWNHDATRLTMFIHPGRIKEGVNLREEEGPVLVPNRRYTLVIREKMLDAKGQPLGQAFTKQFTTTAEDHERIDISRWSLHSPQGNSRAPLRLELPKALDRHLLARCLRVNDAQGNRVEGVVEVLDGERVWQFTPATAWRAEQHTLDVDSVLEDQCGNTPLRRFDNELKDKEQEASESAVPLQLSFQPLRSAATSAGSAPDEMIPLIGRYVAVDNVCAWPNLKVLRDGTLVAMIFGQPSHGRMEGDVECWASSDGRFWEKRGIAAQHEPSANRMNVAAGLDRAGNLLVLSSGWSLKREGSEFALGEILPAWSCRSPDARTWTVRKETLPPPSEDTTNYIPFGDIFVAADGSLRTSCYAKLKVADGSTAKSQHRSWVFRSEDGNQWKLGSLIGPVHNETTLFHLRADKWLAAARREFVELFRSDDDCATWQSLGPVTQRNEINAHLQRLADGRLLTFGRRIAGRFGVAARLSSDEGKTWGQPMTIVGDLLSRDCGYPSSVQRPDGAIVTAYYASGVAGHQRYHMGVALWNPPTETKGE